LFYTKNANNTKNANIYLQNIINAAYWFADEVSDTTMMTIALTARAKKKKYYVR
jgi:hypothetical protein